MLRVGLTGGIASGKSHVLRRLAQRGLAVLDLDAVAHGLTAVGGDAYADVIAAFGPEIVAGDGSIDRKALGSIVFGDADARARLNALVHPRVREEEARRAAALERAGARVLVSDAALLVEAGLHLRFARLVVVHCAPEQQLARLRARDGLDEASARARLAAQMPVNEKREFGHYSIDSSGTPDETDRATDELAEELRALALRGDARARVPLERLLGALTHGPRSGPRGLTPAAILASALEQGAIELSVLCAHLVPPATGPWYRAAAGVAPGAPASSLATALVAWATGRAGADEPFVAAAAASLARLTHTRPADRADASLFALVLQHVLTGAAAAPAGAVAARLMPLAQRWGGGAPSASLGPVWVAADRFPGRPAAAAAECESLGGDASLAGALAGATAGLDAALAPPPLVAKLRALRRESP